MCSYDAAALTSQLIEELSIYRIECSHEKAEILVEYLRLVIEKNKQLNLTRITEPSDAVSRHIVDSLVPLATDPLIGLLKGSQKVNFLDIGTGAGFPGIPLAVMTGMNGLLIDSVGKKVAAVNEFIDALRLNDVMAKHCRVEELALEQPASFDLVVTRAVAQSNVLLEYASPLLKKNGLLVLEKANVTEDEFSHAEAAASLCGFSLVSRETFELPHELGHREILTYKKMSKAKVKLPRQNGLAKKKPLGE